MWFMSSLHSACSAYQQSCTLLKIKWLAGRLKNILKKKKSSVLHAPPPPGDSLEPPLSASPTCGRRVTSLRSWPKVILRRSGHQGAPCRECALQVLQDWTKRGVTRARSSVPRGFMLQRGSRRAGPGLHSWSAGAHACSGMVTRVEPQARDLLILFLTQIARSTVSHGTPLQSNINPPGAPPTIAEVNCPPVLLGCHRQRAEKVPEGRLAFGFKIVLSPVGLLEGDWRSVTLGTSGARSLHSADTIPQI